MNNSRSNITRRRLLECGAAAGVGLALPGTRKLMAAELTCDDVICMPIPSTGETIPVIGVGTNRFGRTEVPVIRDVLEAMYEHGGRVIDTAAQYGQSEVVIGEALSNPELREAMFVATKFDAPGAQFRGPLGPPPPGAISADESFERSLDRLNIDHVDLLFAHFVSSVEPLMPRLIELKAEGRTKYIGITSVQREQHAQIMEYMREYPIDFLQIDYSLGNRAAATDVLELALERDIAVMAAVPFGGRRNSLFADAGDNALPEWAAEFGAATWGQFFLKYVVSHPAVNCAIPGTTDVEHMLDNQKAGHGVLPDQDMRQRMEAYWDSIT